MAHQASCRAPSASCAQVVEGCDHGLQEGDVWHLVRVHPGKDVHHRPANVLGVEVVAVVQQTFVDLRVGHGLVMRYVRELLEEPEELLRLFVDHIAHGARRLSDLLRLVPLLGSRLGPLRIGGVEILHERRLRLEHVLGVVLVQEHVAELVVADLAVLSDVEMPHEDQHLLGGRLEAPLVQGLLELLLGDDSILVGIESPEDVPYQRVLLPHALPDLLEHGRQVVRANVATLLDVFPRVLVHVHDLELPVVHLDDAAGAQVGILEDLTGDLVHVNALFQVPARDDAHVPLGGLVDRHCIIEEVEIDDE
mmetsp:Transcript_607/g.2582  ORF Transcript_607/g.2582 Transcript_607/m.2582 type:complete len:308 (-) Transcript_607:460-1383(-)